MDREGEEITDKAMDEILDNLVDFLFTRSQENVLRYKKWDTGFMARSGNVSLREFLHKQITYSAPYAANVEFGRESGSFPPREPIKKWLIRKLHVSEKEAEGISWAICKKIEKKGIKPSPFMRDAIKETKSEFGML